GLAGLLAPQGRVFAVQGQQFGVSAALDDLALADDQNFVGVGDVVFEEVSFRHSARAVGLKEVSCGAVPGTMTAFVGPSGAGKTTLVRLALRLIDPQGGEVRLDGVPLPKLKMAALRQAIALVP
ncbi:ATP-binding cassette domain-containing protein, partial [Staphylococcus aureus]|uniref:ATP-binding cassette domain-containing protein n=1 Tax=Staphylococcus aureus TaxID=1280 RepID=UPI00132F6500